MPQPVAGLQLGRNLHGFVIAMPKIQPSLNWTTECLGRHSFGYFPRFQACKMSSIAQRRNISKGTLVFSSPSDFRWELKRMAPFVTNGWAPATSLCPLIFASSVWGFLRPNLLPFRAGVAFYPCACLNANSRIPPCLHACALHLAGNQICRVNNGKDNHDLMPNLLN